MDRLEALMYWCLAGWEVDLAQSEHAASRARGGRQAWDVELAFHRWVAMELCQRQAQLTSNEEACQAALAESCSSVSGAPHSASSWRAP